MKLLVIGLLLGVFEARYSPDGPGCPQTPLDDQCHMLHNIYSYKFVRNKYLGNSIPLAYTLMSLRLDLTQMVLAVQKHLQMTNIIMLEYFYFCNFPRKSIPGDVLAHSLP